MKSNFFLIFLFSFSALNAQSPSTLNLEEALTIMLQQNYDIQLAQQDVEIANNNASILNSGYLPTVTGNANASVSYFRGENETVQGDRAFDPAESYNYGANISLNYTIFNGSRRYNVKSFQEQFNLSFLQAKQVIEQTSLQFATEFFESARLQEQLLSQSEALSISKQRLNRAQKNFEFGQANSLDVLNAQVDVDNDSLAVLNTKQDLENRKRTLNLMMGRTISMQFEIDSEITFKIQKSEEECLSAAIQNNTQIKISESQLNNTEFALQSAKGNWFPELNLNATYQYSGSDNPNGAFLIGAYNTGPQANLSFSWNIFDGGRTLTNIRNSEIQLQQQKIQQKNVLESIKRDVLNAYTSYQNSLFVYQSQQTNVSTAVQNFERTELQYQQGQISSIEYRQAQINLLNAKLSLSEAKYNAKLAELQLLQIIGS